VRRVAPSARSHALAACVDVASRRRRRTHEALQWKSAIHLSRIDADCAAAT
jgi:hypothetical protein